MTAATFQGAKRRQSLTGKLGAALAARAGTKGKPGKLAAAMAVAREHVVTAAALASVDFGAFHLSHGWGWFAVGFSVLALDFAVRG